MAMQRDELQGLISSLVEATDGSRADDYAVLVEEVNGLYDDRDKEASRADALEIKNGELKKENFKLFSRVGAPKEGTVVSPTVEEPEEEKEDYLKDILNEKGWWK